MARQLPLEERFETFVHQTNTTTIPLGTSVDTIIYSPGVGKRARVQWVWADARFPAAPGVNDIGIASLRLTRGGVVVRLGSVRIVQVDGQRERTIGFPCDFIMAEDDDFSVLGNAISSAIDIDVAASLRALEYAAF